MFGLPVVTILLAAAQDHSSVWPRTKAEATGYANTSTYEDVLSFLRDLQRLGAPIRVQMIGNSPKGRPIPLVLASVPQVGSVEQARKAGKIVVYVQANIHAGEVEGKEAILAILRRLCQQGRHGLLSKMVLLVTPIYNVDGNEAFGSVFKNRPEQDGPDPVGERANGDGLDLNRDAIKAESPEMRAVLREVYNKWDPAVMMDLHTTDGTRHGWELTYSPPLNPNTDPNVLNYSREKMVPAVRKEVEALAKEPLFDYGNLETVKGRRGWFTYGYEGRYCTNYVGLRNRIAILSEATAFIPFKDRVEVTDRFVTSVLEYSVKHSREIQALERKADLGACDQLGISFQFQSRGEEPVLLESSSSLAQAERIAKPAHTRPTELERQRLPVFDRFAVVKWASSPMGYIVSGRNSELIELLRRHGVRMVPPRFKHAEAEQFVVSKLNQADRPFQRHRLIRLEGAYRPLAYAPAEGDHFVPMSQPLRRLVFQILEPESDDGAVAWGFLGEAFPMGSALPILKVRSVAEPSFRGSLQIRKGPALRKGPFYVALEPRRTR